MDVVKTLSIFGSACSPSTALFAPNVFRTFFTVSPEIFRTFLFTFFFVQFFALLSRWLLSGRLSGILCELKGCLSGSAVESLVIFSAFLGSNAKCILQLHLLKGPWASQNSKTRHPFWLMSELHSNVGLNFVRIFVWMFLSEFSCLIFWSEFACLDFFVWIMFGFCLICCVRILSGFSISPCLKMVRSSQTCLNFV